MDLNTMLQKNYGYQGAPVPTPAPTPVPQMQKANDTDPTIVAQEGKKPRILRSVGDIYSAMQAQTIFNPNAQAPVKPPKQEDAMSDALGTQGRWGTPQNGG